MLRYATVCSGIEAPSVAWEPLGWRPVFFSEIEPFPKKVLTHRWPGVPDLGDMTAIDGVAWRGKVDVLCGGTPCQAFSIAGARRGLADERGNLTLRFAGLCDEMRPEFVLWENVPGVLSSKDNAFGCFLAMLAGEDEAFVPAGRKWTHAGYVLGPERAIAWRCLDAQYFGLAQRRKRVFVVASPRGGTDPREILFEREGVRRDTAPSREAGQEIAAYACQGSNVGEFGTLRAGNGNSAGGVPFVPVAYGGGAPGHLHVATTTAHPSRLDFKSETFVVSIAENQRAEVVLSDVTQALSKGGGKPGQGYPAVLTYRTTENSGVYETGERIDALVTGTDRTSHLVQQNLRVRRLMPVECERLQGFPDGYTAIPGAADGPRYRALGNGMAVPVIRWIGRRIQQIALASLLG